MITIDHTDNTADNDITGRQIMCRKNSNLPMVSAFKIKCLSADYTKIILEIKIITFIS